MSAGGNVIEELLVKLGLDVEEAEFAKGIAIGELLAKGFEKLVEVAHEVWAEFKNLAPETAAYAENARKGAQITGMTAEAFQELAFAAKETGVSAETMQQSLILLSHSASAAALGSGDSAFAFRQLGVSVKGSNGQIKSADVLLGDLAESFAKMPDSLKKTDLARQIFGRGGAQLIPTLNKGKEGIAELREEAHKYGVVLSTEAIEKSRQWTIAQSELSESIEGLKMGLGQELMDTGFTKSLTEFILMIRPKIVDLFRIAITKLRETITSLKPAFRVVAAGAKSAMEALLLMAGAAGVVYLAFTAAGRAAVVAALEAAAAWLIAAAPVVAMVAALGLVFLLLQDVLTYLNGGDSLTGRMIQKIKDEWPHLIDDLKAKWTEFKVWIIKTAEDIGKGILDALKHPIDTLTGAPGKIKGSVEGGLHSTDSGLSNFMAAMPNWMTGGYGAKREAYLSNQAASQAPSMIANIQIDAPGGDPKAVSDAAKQGVKDAFNEHMNAILRDAQTHVDY